MQRILIFLTFIIFFFCSTDTTTSTVLTDTTTSTVLTDTTTSTVLTDTTTSTVLTDTTTSTVLTDKANKTEITFNTCPYSGILGQELEFNFSITSGDNEILEIKNIWNVYIYDIKNGEFILTNTKKGTTEKFTEFGIALPPVNTTYEYRNSKGSLVGDVFELVIEVTDENNNVTVDNCEVILKQPEFFAIPQDLKPGRYKNINFENDPTCFIEIYIGEPIEENILFSGFQGKNTAVDIYETDTYFGSYRCGKWVSVDTITKQPKDTFEDGTFIINLDIVPGKYFTTVPIDKTCSYRLLSNFRDVQNWFEINYEEENEFIEIDILEDTIGFFSSDCGVWQKNN
jgi:hypothetical protein